MNVSDKARLRSVKVRQPKEVIDWQQSERCTIDQGTDWQKSQEYISCFTVFDTPSYFSESFCTNIPVASGEGRLLDVGSGTGVVGLYCLVHGKAKFATFTDKQWKAVSESWANALRGIEATKIRADQVAFCEPMEFEKIPSEIVAEHDLIAFNPPQIPMQMLTPTGQAKINNDPSTGAYRNGGDSGLEYAEKFLHWYSELGKSRPAAAILLSSLIGPSLIENTIGRHRLRIMDTKSSRVRLREDFWAEVEKLSDSDREERRLQRDAKFTWTKELITYSLR